MKKTLTLRIFKTEDIIPLVKRLFMILFAYAAAAAFALPASAQGFSPELNSVQPGNMIVIPQSGAVPNSASYECPPMTVNPFMDICGKVIYPYVPARLLDASQAVPVDYRFSSGDCVRIEFVGDVYYAAKYCLSNNGGLYFTALYGSGGQDTDGYFSFVTGTKALGSTIGELQVKLSQAAGKVFKNKFKLSVSLTEIQTFTVNVLGAVLKPGTFTANGAMRVSEAIVAASGILDSSSIRTVSVMRVSDKLSVDLYKFYDGEDTASNIFLQANDIIFVGRADHFISLTGRFRSPGKYEILPQESKEDLYRYAQGFSIDASKANAVISNRSAAGKVAVKTASLDDPGSVDIATLDSIYLPSTKKLEDFIYIVLGDGTNIPVFTDTPMTLRQLLDGKIPPDRYTTLDLSNLVVTKPNTTNPSAGPFTFKYDGNTNPKVLEETKIDPGDTVYMTDILQDIFVTGAVRSPGVIKYKTGLTLNDYMYLAGGPSDSAKLGSVRIRRKMNATSEGNELHVNAKEESSTLVILPGDIIYVPTRTRVPLSSYMGQLLSYMAFINVFNNNK